jgi:hypothetical protein
MAALQIMSVPDPDSTLNQLEYVLTWCYRWLCVHVITFASNTAVFKGVPGVCAAERENAVSEGGVSVSATGKQGGQGPRAMISLSRLVCWCFMQMYDNTWRHDRAGCLRQIECMAGVICD